MLFDGDVEAADKRFPVERFRQKANRTAVQCLSAGFFRRNGRYEQER